MASDTARTIWVVDNYDSFAHNAVDLLRQLGAAVAVVRSDAAQIEDILSPRTAGVVLSPGPGRPESGGVCIDLCRRAGPLGLPVLGICLGHQALSVAYGGVVGPARRPLHGRASWIVNLRLGLLRALPARFQAARYHSLAVAPEQVGEGLRVTCRSEDGEIMGLVHEAFPLEGVQFHPESYLTPTGPRILAAFLRRCGIRPRPPRGVRR